MRLQYTVSVLIYGPGDCQISISMSHLMVGGVWYLREMGGSRSKLFGQKKSNISVSCLKL